MKSNKRKSSKDHRITTNIFYIRILSPITSAKITMTKFTERDGIAVLQIIVFFPCLLLSLFLCFKQGLKAVASCWRFLIILACLRLGGAICQIILMTNHTRPAVVAKLTCDLLGIAPLTLACLGLMQRV